MFRLKLLIKWPNFSKKNTFSISSQVLDQLGRTSAFHNIMRRSVAMRDAGLYDKHGHLELTNLRLTVEKVFGPNLQILLKSCKKKRKQLEYLLPNVQKSVKRNYPAYSDGVKKRTTYKARHQDKPSATSYGSWANLRTSRVPQNRGSRSAFRLGQEVPLAPAQDVQQQWLQEDDWINS